MKESIINCQGNQIKYTLVRKKVKNVNLRVRSDGTVVVSADKRVPLAFIEKLILEKAPWILNNLERIEKKIDTLPEKLYISGEILPFLDRRMTLKVLPADDAEKIWFKDDILHLAVFEDSDAEIRKQMVDFWYKKQAEPVFYQAMDRIYPLVAEHGISRPTLTVRTMKTRWGSCSWQKGKITLNSELLKTSLDCIDYVVLHELAHFKHRGHNSAFYGFLSEIMPDWQGRRHILKNYRWSV
jgi:predicted metal-dependent hydrolase